MPKTLVYSLFIINYYCQNPSAAVWSIPLRRVLWLLVHFLNYLCQKKPAKLAVEGTDADAVAGADATDAARGAEASPATTSSRWRRRTRSRRPRIFSQRPQTQNQKRVGDTLEDFLVSFSNSRAIFHVDLADFSILYTSPKFAPPPHWDPRC